MNNSKTPKIVVGVGLAAVYATALGVFAMRDGNDNVVRETASDASIAQVAAATVPEPAIVAQTSETPASETEQRAVDSVAAVPPATSTRQNAGTSQIQMNPVVENARNPQPVDAAADVPAPALTERAPAVNDSPIPADEEPSVAAPPDDPTEATGNEGSADQAAPEPIVE